jgi:hypothetical protein
VDATEKSLFVKIRQSSIIRPIKGSKKYENILQTKLVNVFNPRLWIVIDRSSNRKICR